MDIIKSASAMMGAKVSLSSSIACKIGGIGNLLLQGGKGVFLFIRDCEDPFKEIRVLI